MDRSISILNRLLILQKAPEFGDGKPSNLPLPRPWPPHIVEPNCRAGKWRTLFCRSSSLKPPRSITKRWKPHSSKFPWKRQKSEDWKMKTSVSEDCLRLSKVGDSFFNAKLALEAEADRRDEQRQRGPSEKKGVLFRFTSHVGTYASKLISYWFPQKREFFGHS